MKGKKKNNHPIFNNVLHYFAACMNKKVKYFLDWRNFFKEKNYQKILANISIYLFI